MEFSDEWSEKISWADLDGDGTEEYILLESGDFLNQNIINGKITMYVNNELVYQYTEELRTIGVGDMSSNAFPITVVLGKKDFNLSICCEGWEGEIPFDATGIMNLGKQSLWTEIM